MENIVNDGTTSYETRIGATADLDLCLRVKEDFVKNEDVMVVAGDMMFQDQKFDMSHVTKYFQSKRHEGDLAIYYELGIIIIAKLNEFLLKKSFIFVR